MIIFWKDIHFLDFKINKYNGTTRNKKHRAESAKFERHNI